MNKKIIIIILALVVFVGGYFLVKGMDKDSPNQEATVPTNSQANNNQENPIVNVEIESDAAKTTTTYEVVYTNSGYSPSALTIKVGDTVTFKNQSSANVWTGSAMHPTHMLYGGTNLQSHCPDVENNDFDQCQNGAPGTSWSFTFTKKGVWGYHNHVNSSHFGKITVE